MTYQELLTDALNTDDIIIAHYVFYAVQKGAVQLTAMYEEDFVYQLDDADIIIIHDMIKQDYLKMRIVKLYAVPLNNQEFAFYFAKAPTDIIGLHTSRFRQEPIKIIDAQRMMNHELWFPETNTFKRFIDIKKETVNYPTLVCVLEKS